MIETIVHVHDNRSRYCLSARRTTNTQTSADSSAEELKLMLADQDQKVTSQAALAALAHADLCSSCTMPRSRSREPFHGW